MMKRLTLSLLSFTVLSALLSCRHAEKSACSIILLAPQSGTQAAIGVQVDRARILVEDEMQTAGDSGIAIREVDTESQPAVAQAELERSLSQKDTPIVVGSVLSSETREFLEKTLRRGTVVLANGSSDPTIRSLPFRHPGDGFFRNWPPDDAEGREMAEYLITNQRAHKLAAFYANDAYARALVNAFTKRFTELGGTVLGPEVYQLSATSFEPILRRLPNDVDGYYIVGLPPDLAGMYNAIRRGPNRLKPIYTAVAAETSEFVSLVTSPPDNVFYTAPL